MNDDKTIFSKKHRENISKSMKGHPVSDETRNKIGTANKKRWAKYKEALAKVEKAESE